MTNIPNDWFKDPLKPWRGVHRHVSIACTLPLGGWPIVRQIIAGTPKEDMSKRAFFPKVTLSCAQCHKAFVRTVAEARKKNSDDQSPTFCSNRCSTIFGNTKHGKTGPNCNVCGAKMPKALGKRQCSSQCAEIAKARWRQIVYSKRLNLPDVPCEECGMPVRQKTATKVQRFCSRLCKNAAHSKMMKAEGNPGWRGGVDHVRYAPGVLTAYNRMRPQIIERDGRMCVKCRSSKGLTVHHIDMDAANNSPTNLATLCGACHTDFHAAERSRQSLTEWSWLKTYAEKKSSTTFK